MSAQLTLADAAYIAYGYVEQKCKTTNCNCMVMVPPWFKPQKDFCDTCRAVNIDDTSGLDNERDTEATSEETV